MKPKFSLIKLNWRNYVGDVVKRNVVIVFDNCLDVYNFDVWKWFGRSWCLWKMEVLRLNEGWKWLILWFMWEGWENRCRHWILGHRLTFLSIWQFFLCSETRLLLMKSIFIYSHVYIWIRNNINIHIFSCLYLNKK